MLVLHTRTCTQHSPAAVDDDVGAGAGGSMRIRWTTRRLTGPPGGFSFDGILHRAVQQT